MKGGRGYEEKQIGISSLGISGPDRETPSSKLLPNTQVLDKGVCTNPSMKTGCIKGSSSSVNVA